MGGCLRRQSEEEQNISISKKVEQKKKKKNIKQINIISKLKIPQVRRRQWERVEKSEASRCNTQITMYIPFME
jgi:hypothetical protein